MFPTLRLAEKPAPKPATAELGSTGMGYRIGAKSENIRRLLRMEYSYELAGVSGYRIYDRMRFSDPKVAGLRRAMNLPLLGAAVRIEPVDPEDAKAIEVADFVREMLLSDGPFGMREPWRAFLSQALLHLDYGCAPFEMVWALRDGKAVIERFAYRPPATVCDGIDIERGRIASVTQVTTTGENAFIPGEKLLWFCHEREGDNWLGRALLRPMYKPWFYKEKAEILLLIGLEKGPGIPYGQEQEGGLKPDQRSELDAALEALHVSERAYLRAPEGVAVSMLAANASLADGLELVRYWDTQLSNVAIAQVLDLGKTETGSRALGRTMSDMFVDSLTAVATSIEDTMNAAEGPIAQLVAYNFASADDLMPRLRFGSLTKPDIKALAAGLFQCNQMGMEFGEETWEWIRSELDLPAREAQDEVAPQTPPPAAIPETPPAEPDTASPDDEPAAGEVSAAEGGRYRRALTTLESYVALDEIAAALDGAKDAVRTRTQAIRDRMVAELAKRALAAAQSGSVAKVAALAQAKAPMVDVLAREVRAVFGEYFEAGRAQVADELARQKVGDPVVDEITGERRGEALTMAASVRPLTETESRRFYELLDLEGEVAARKMAAAAMSSAAVAATRALTTPMSLDVLRTLIGRASDEAALQVGWSITQVVIHGRSAEAQAERHLIEKAVYSTILDGNTCAECEPRDGDETTDLEEAEGWCPNPDCLGGDACRCLQIYEYKVGA